MLVEAADHGAAARKDETSVDEIGGKFRRAPLKGVAYEFHDRGDGVGERFADFNGGDGNGLGQARNGIASAHLHGDFLFELKSGPRPDLDLFGGPFADHEVVGAFQVIDDGVIDFIATDADALGVDDSGKGNDSDFGGTTADINNHIGGRFVDREPHADCGGHRFFNKDNIACARPDGGILNSAPLDFGNPGGNGNNDAGCDESFFAVHLVDEITEHCFRDLKVCNHAVLHGANRGDVARSAAQHFFRFRTNCADFFGGGIDRHHAWFAQHNTFILGENKGVRGSEVDADVVGEKS